MNRLSMIIVLTIWVLPMSLFSTSIHAVSQNGSRSIGDNQAPLNTIAFQYENGLIDADINDAPIGKVLDELKAKTGTRVNIHDPSILASRLSATLKGIPLDKTIQILLEGFSYALYPRDDTFAVTILSTVPETVMSHRRFTSEQEVEAQSAADPNSETVPKSLDEFQPIKMEERWLGVNHAEHESSEGSEQLMIEQRYQEALVQRAQDAINSEHEHLYKHALNQLVGINDPQATEMLIDATTMETNWISRAQAVDALSQHAANLQFADTTSIDALKQLSEDGNNEVSSVALKALREIEQYQDNEE